jgi:siroheme synthase (precorrin-2 oxidase/ferrochelatase)
MERTSDTHWIGDWVGSTVAKRKIHTHAQKGSLVRFISEQEGRETSDSQQLMPDTGRCSSRVQIMWRVATYLCDENKTNWMHLPLTSAELAVCAVDARQKSDASG